MAIPVYVKDIENLFAKWITVSVPQSLFTFKAPDATFESFKAVWRDLEMSYIHGSNYQPICTEHEYMRLLFSATYCTSTSLIFLTVSSVFIHGHVQASTRSDLLSPHDLGEPTSQTSLPNSNFFVYVSTQKP
jgi:hypothetical protein